MQEKEAVWQEIRNRVFQKYGSVRRNIGQRTETDDRGGSAAVW